MFESSECAQLVIFHKNVNEYFSQSQSCKITCSLYHHDIIKIYVTYMHSEVALLLCDDLIMLLETNLFVLETHSFHANVILFGRMSYYLEK